jgi:hypothetical protein
MGVNTFLNEEPDPEVVARSLDMIREGGYSFIRQIFGWYEIEPQPGVHVDTNGNSTWEKYDRIVDEATARGIEIIARLEKPPLWAKTGQPNPHVDGPPDRLSDYANFVEQVVRRYRGRITYVQIWNEPNLQGEWGAKPIDPLGYVRLLEAGHRAAKRADPNVVVLLAGLAPTDQTGPDNLSDLLFLERVYEYGGADFFDIATVMVYGYGYAPSDRRTGFGHNNFSRPVLTREIMERHGDGGTPIWAVEYGWVALPDDWEGDPSPWGEPVSQERQAEYLYHGYLRAQREWPWMGVMAVWAFRFPHPPDAPDQIGNPTRGFALVEHDFTPRPAYTLLKDRAARIQADGTGTYVFTEPERERVERGEPTDLRVSGERVDLRVAGAGRIERIIDGRWRDALTFDVEGEGTRRVTVASGMRDTAHLVSLRVSRLPGESPPEIIGYVVSHVWFHNWIYPWLTGLLIVVLLANAASLGWAIRDWRSNRRASGAWLPRQLSRASCVILNNEGSEREEEPSYAS